MLVEQNTRKGIGYMCLAAVIFAAQDGISRHLAAEYNVLMIVMIRFWFFALFVSYLASRAKGGLRAAVRTRYPKLQVLRGVILAAEVSTMFVGFVKLGLIESNAIFTAYPLLVAALSGPILGEVVGWRRWSAIAVGFVGVLIILQPGTGVFSVWSLVPFAAALMFALYSLLTRYVARSDAVSVSFFYTGTAGAAAMTLVGLWFWQPMSDADWVWMAILCCSAAAGHWSLIKSYEVAEASAVQPFAYLQLVVVSAIGMSLFGEVLRVNVVIGGALVVAAGLFTLWRQAVRERAARAGV
jgi:drug/metabolite transporter (DMT)-like permease